MRLIQITLLFLFCLATLMSTFSNAAEHTLRVRTLGDPLTFDWNRAYTPTESNFVRNIQEGLVRIEALPQKPTHLKIMPALAKKWKISADSKTYTFTLEQHVKWSDGVELSAEHFVNSWKRLLSPEFKSNTAYILFDIVNAKEFHEGSITDFSQVGIKALNKYTLQVQLRAPIAYWIWIPSFWSTYPIRQDLIEKFGSVQWATKENMVSLGAFKIDSYEKGKKVELVKNPLYYGKKGNLDRIVAALIEDDATALKLYESGQLDFVSKIASTDLKRIKENVKLRSMLTQWPEARVVHLNFNPQHPLLKDLNFRKALAMSIDKNKLGSLIESAYETATTLVTPGIQGHSKDKSIISFNPVEARKIISNFPQPISLDLVAIQSTDEILTAQFIQSELKKNLGIDVKTHFYEAKQFYSPILNQTGFAMILNRWTADFPDPDNFFSLFLSGTGNNRIQFKNERYDELVVKARSQTDSLRKSTYDEIQKILLLDEVVVVPLYYGKNSALISPKIKGFYPSSINTYLFKDFSITD